MGSSEGTVLGVGRACTHIRMQSFYVLAALLGVTACMDVGRSGVYDSPLANDYYVKVWIHVWWWAEWTAGSTGHAKQGGLLPPLHSAKLLQFVLSSTVTCKD